jgi:hypothetical protein
MFQYEKDMIPVLRKGLCYKYNTEYFIEEFASGLGIADLVFTTEINKREMVLNDFEAMFYLNEYFNKKNKKIVIEDLIKTYSLKKNKTYLAIKFLNCLGLIKEYEEGKYFITDLFTPSTIALYSIEAKIKDWKKGLFQAIRYKTYSHKTFLAISQEFVHRVDQNLLLENNVGLISVDPDNIKVILDPQINLPINKTAYFYLSESFVDKLNGKTSMLA